MMVLKLEHASEFLRGRFKTDFGCKETQGATGLTSKSLGTGGHSRTHLNQLLFFKNLHSSSSPGALGCL